MDISKFTERRNIEISSYKDNTIHNYKIKLPIDKYKTKTESLLNIDKENNYIGGDVWLCLWFRTGKMGNQISFEYNRFSNKKMYTKKSQNGSIGKYFIESYFPIEMIQFIKKGLLVFEKIIKERKKYIRISRNEFQELVDNEFNKEDDDGENKNI